MRQRPVMRDVALFCALALTCCLVAAPSAAQSSQPTVVSLWGGARHSIVLLSDGSIWDWGLNTWGKLGDGTASTYTSGFTTPAIDHDHHTPVRVHGVGDVGYFGPAAAIMGGESHNFALKADGTVWSWGYNAFGQLGDGTNVDRYTPVQVAGLDSVVSLGGRGYHSLVVKADGSVWTWGFNSTGQLGDGTTTNQNRPVQVPGLSGVLAVTGGYNFSLALMSDHTLRAWGNGSSGQLGNGATAQSLVPVALTGLTNVAQVSAGWKHAVAVRFDGTVWTWGQNTNGQLGNGTTTDSTVPVQVSGLTNVIAVSGGDCHTAALKADGTVWAWGCNNNSKGVGNFEVGDGTSIERHAPVQVSGLRNVVAIAARDYHNVALRSDGTVWAWGFNENGQLGDGTTIDRSVPVQVLGLGPTLVSDQAHPADANADGRLTIGEVTAYAAAWSKGHTWPTGPNPIAIDYVTRAGYLWRAGERYAVDAAAGGCPSCWVAVAALPASDAVAPFDRLPSAPATTRR